MARIIVGRFSSYQHAIDTTQDLLRNNIAREHLSLVAPRVEETPDTQSPGGEPAQGGATELTAGVGAMALAGAASLVLTGIGPALVAGPLAALLGAQTAEDDDESAEDIRFQRILIDANIAASAEDARAYLEDVRAGSTILAVEADDRQEDMVAEILHRHGGAGLTFRRLPS